MKALLQTALNSPVLFHLTPLLHLNPPPESCPSHTYMKLIEIYHNADIEGWKKWKVSNKGGVGDTFETKVGGWKYDGLEGEVCIESKR